MEDAELAAIRARRMAEMQAQYGGGGAGGRPGSGGAAGRMAGLPAGMGGAPGGAAGGKADAEEQKKAMEEMRQNMLMQILDTDARERLGRVSIVKPEKARAVEDYLINMARMGKMTTKIDENQLIELLEQVTEQGKKDTKITVNRKRYESDSDEDYGF